MIGWGVLPGSWEAARDKARRINLIEPVVEGIIQLFFQSIILYIVTGPTADNGDRISIDNSPLFINLSHYLSISTYQLLYHRRTTGSLLASVHTNDNQFKSVLWVCPNHVHNKSGHQLCQAPHTGP